jgi:hypothetical protein
VYPGQKGLPRGSVESLSNATAGIGRISESRGTLVLCVCVLSCAFALVYLPDVGRGLLKDDFGWIARSAVRSWRAAAALFRTAPTNDFFRPVVTLSFAVNRPICGLDSRCYGITNFCLALACAIGVALVAKALSIRAGAALFSAAVWIFNWHGINMAVLWISGRTALMLTVCAAFGVLALICRRSALGVALISCAIFSKEEGVLLPVMIGAWLFIDARIRRDWTTLRAMLPPVLCLFAADAVYLLLRSQSGAVTNATAPEYYRFSFTAARLASNLPEYLDRSATFAAVALLLFFIIGKVRWRAMPPEITSALCLGVVWWVGGFAITIFLPGRSSLYALFPSVGIALIAGAIASALWDGIAESRKRRLIIAGLLLPLLLWPVYHSRNRPAVREAELSQRTLAALQRVATARGAGTSVLLEDDLSERPSLDNAFSSGIQVAADLFIYPPIRVRISTPNDDAEPPGSTDPPSYDVRLVLSNGALREVSSR